MTSWYYQKVTITFPLFQDDLNLKGQIGPKDIVRIFTNTDPKFKVSYDAKKVAKGSIPYSAENLVVSGTLVRKNALAGSE